MENIKLEDLVPLMMKAVTMGAEVGVSAALVLVAQAITLTGGMEERSWGLLGFGIALLVVVLFQIRISVERNAPGMLTIAIVILVLGAVLQPLVMLGVPGFVSQRPELAEIIPHLAMIAGTMLIISGIAAILAFRTVKEVNKNLSEMGVRL